MRERTSRACAVLLASMLVLAACGRRKESLVGTPEHPFVLLLSPSHAPASTAALDGLARALGAASGMEFSVRVASSALDSVSRFGYGTADAGILTLDEYLLARQEYGVSAWLQVLRGKGSSEYEGVLLVRARDGVKDLQRLSGKPVAFVDPYSTSGFLLPAVQLRASGVLIVPEFTGSHAESVRRLRSGRVDAAATYAGMAARHPDLRVLDKTGAIPNEPVVVRKDLLPEKRKAFLEAFATLGETAEGRKLLSGIADITGARPVTERDYQPVHDFLRSTGKTVYDLVPEGWEIHRLNQPYWQN